MTELIYNFPKYGFICNDTSSTFQVIDIDLDGVPEVVTCSNTGATMMPLITCVFYYDGEKYVSGTVEKDEDDVETILPLRLYSDSGSQSGYSVFTQIPQVNEDDPIPSFSSFWYARNNGVCKVTFKNGILRFDTVLDLGTYRDVIFDGDSIDSEKEKAWNGYKSELFAFKDMHHEAEQYNLYILYDVPVGPLFDDSDLSGYHDVVDKALAEEISEGYFNGCVERDYYA